MITQSQNGDLLEHIAGLERELSELRRRAEPGSNGGAPVDWHRTLLESVVNNTRNVIYVKDLAGQFILVNDRFCEILGVPRDAIVGKMPGTIYSPQVSANHLANDNLVAASRRP